MTICFNPKCLQENSDTNNRCSSCGAELLLNDRYRCLKLLARGCFSFTFFALEQISLRFCIIKQFDSSFFKAKELQIKTLLPLKINALIPLVLDFFCLEENFYLVQEYISGVNLKVLLAEKGSFSEEEIWLLLGEILPLLKYIHERKVIHGDIKPENIIRRELDGRFILVDYGCFSPQTSGSSSPEYCPPEELITTQSDLYSLGVSCIHLLCDIKPFDLFDEHKHDWVWQDYLTSPVSEALKKILDSLIKLNPKERFASAKEAIAGIQQLGYAQTITQSWPKRFQWVCLNTLTNLSPVNAVAFSPNGKLLAFGGDDGIITLTNLENTQEIATLEGHSLGIQSLGFAGNEVLVSASDDRSIKVWELKNLQARLTLNQHTGFVKDLSISADGKILASASWDKTVKLWNLNSGELLSNLVAHRLQVLGVSLSRDGKWLASGGSDRTVRLWRLESQPKLYRTLNEHIASVIAVAFSANSKLLASAGDDRMIKIWDVVNGKLIRSISAHSWGVVSLAFIDEDKMLVSGSWDKSLKIWSVETAEQVAVLSAHEDCVTKVAINHDGKLIASASKDKSIKLWQREKGVYFL